jgi:hypothetical protein
MFSRCSTALSHALKLFFLSTLDLYLEVQQAELVTGRGDREVVEVAEVVVEVAVAAVATRGWLKSSREQLRQKQWGSEA